MTKKVLSLALAAAIVALPLPASQLLAASAPLATTPDVTEAMAALHADPFLIDQLSFEKPSDLKDLVGAQL